MAEQAAVSQVEEAMLVKEIISGDKQAFRQFIHLYERLVVSVVFKMVPQREDAEDICQDVFLKVYEKLPSFRFRSKLSTWIASIAFNRSVNFLRKRRPILLEDLRQADDEEDSWELRDEGTVDSEGMLLSKEREQLLREGLSRLSPIQRTILELFHYSELSLQEITEITQIPLSTVKSHLFRARKQLKLILEQDYE